MKLSNFLPTVLAASASVSALSVDVRRYLNEQSPIASINSIAPGAGVPIPGDSPISFCSDFNPYEGLVDIDRIAIDPNPPTAGKSLHLEASGTVNERIEEGAYLVVEVKLGLIRLLHRELNFCENLEKANVTVHCPIEKGPLNIIKDQDLPSQIPPGKFVVTANLFTKDDRRITCLHAEVTFRH
ncbi:hypothetical protein ABW20_dc0101541 [Dactylellina cionopaga]|nr:hypothetical protein ABW20_dc0101541 [Dactylellina cionopaga]